MNRKRAGLFLLAAVVGLGITFGFVWRREVPGVSGAFEGASGGRSTTSTLLTAAYGFVITVVGVALGAAYRRLLAVRSQGTTHVRPATLVADVAGSVDFLLGLVGAPLVFGLLWQSLGDISLAGLTVIALQNGFVSHAIVGQFLSGASGGAGGGGGGGPEINAPPPTPSGARHDS